MTVKAYLAGPDVFLPNARAHAQRKVEICGRYGIVGRPPWTKILKVWRPRPKPRPG